MSAETFLDTNVLIYSVTPDDPRCAIAGQCLSSRAIISVQVLNEFVHVASRKLRKTWPEIHAALAVFKGLFPPPHPLDVATHELALMLSERYRLPVYDALIVASALRGGCRTLLSEDFQDGQVIEGLTICNPFAG